MGAEVTSSEVRTKIYSPEIRAEIVRWVSENARPYRIVEDRAFITLMRTGRPNLRLPSASTVARDVRLLFSRTRKRIATMLQVC